MSSETNKTEPKPPAKDDIPTKSYWYPDQTPDLKEVNIGYKIFSSTLLVIPLVLIPISALFVGFVFSTHSHEFYHIYNAIQQESSTTEFWRTLTLFIMGISLLFTMATIYLLRKWRSVYLIDFATYQPSDELKVPYDRFMNHTIASGFFSEENVEFQRKLLYRTGLGQDTYFPPGILNSPPDLSMARAREEADIVMSSCLEELFRRTGLKPRDIDIFIVNCSLFNPTPSLTAMMINKYKMRSDIKNYTLSGMGCSAGVISIDLAKDLLQVYRNSIAVVISMENITQNWYTGNRKSMLVSNTLFRLGGSAMLLSNKYSDSWRAKYRLYCTVRVHKGADDLAYRAVFQEEDENGKKGVALSKELMKVAGDALKSNLTILGPLVLPWSEQIKFFINLCYRKIEGVTGKDKSKRTPAYIPDFKKAFQHFCIHAGGRAIIDGLEENLKLEPHHVEPSRATLYRYGNTSSSSIWYELQFIERSGRLKKGDKIWQIALGSGFKCNSAVWISLRSSNKKIQQPQ